VFVLIGGWGIPATHGILAMGHHQGHVMPELKSVLTLRNLQIGGLLAAIAWSCWPVLLEMSSRWSSDPRYSHGYVVPVLALAILVMRWDRCPVRPESPNCWGLVLIVAGAVLQLIGAYIFNYWLQGMALLPYVMGVALLFGSWSGLRWALPAILFLVFMIPLPYRLEMALGQQLQTIATVISVFSLQLLGLPVLSSGNLIQIGSLKLNVAEACSGLSMLMTFFALSAAAALLIDRPRIYKVVILLSAAPIAVIANVIRIVITSILYQVAGSELAEKVFHDVAGWVMMPLGLGLMWLELWILSKLLVEEGDGSNGKSLHEPDEHPGGSAASTKPASVTSGVAQVTDGAWTDKESSASVAHP
jgi:exosortase